MSGGKQLRLASKEGEEFVVEVEVACKSQLIKNMVEDSGAEEEIPLPNVSSAVLAKVIEYCRHHKDSDPPEIEKPIKSTQISDFVAPWDATFVEVEQEMLFELILAANYLDIKSLLDLTCAKVATMIKGKTPEEIRRQFNIVNDFTPEEEAQIREENRWAEEA
jgi:S-phase kinase-associated protein 1